MQTFRSGVYFETIMYKNNFVSTNIQITKDQRIFLKDSPYNLSAPVRKTINELMENESK